jgi:hypothetical protein
MQRAKLQLEKGKTGSSSCACQPPQWTEFAASPPRGINEAENE